jgi:hypothetical protein
MTLTYQRNRLWALQMEQSRTSVEANHQRLLALWPWWRHPGDSTRIALDKTLSSDSNDLPNPYFDFQAGLTELEGIGQCSDGLGMFRTSGQQADHHDAWGGFDRGIGNGRFGASVGWA